MHPLLGVLAVILVIGLSACSRGENDRSLTSIINAGIEDMEREALPGAELTRKKCGTCHYLDRNFTKVGPPLKGIVGRTPSISGVPFNKWDEESLNLWLQDPSAIKPSTLMAIPGIKSAKERADIIQYLKQL